MKRFIILVLTIMVATGCLAGCDLEDAASQDAITQQEVH